MVQMGMYFDDGYPGETYQRDYTQGRLYKPLTAGKYYCVTFYVTLEQISEYAINHIGAYLDDGSIDAGQDSVGCASPQTAYSPQIVESAIINDTLDWVQVQGLFTATGTETFITIGNFFDIYHTDTIKLSPSTPNNFSLYLIDDVSVVETGTKPDAGPDGFVSPGSDSATIGSSEEGLPLTWFVYGSPVPIGHTGSIKVHPDTTTTYVLSMDLCDGVTSDTVTVWVAPEKVKPLTPKGEPAIWPNPAKGQLTVSNAAGNYLVIYDVFGREVPFDKLTMTSNKEVVDISGLVSGVYVVQIIAPDGNRKCMQLVKE